MVSGERGIRTQPILDSVRAHVSAADQHPRRFETMLDVVHQQAKILERPDWSMPGNIPGRGQLPQLL